MFALLPPPWNLVAKFGSYLLLAIALVAALAYAKYEIWHWCNTACVELKADVAERDVSIARTQAAADEMRARWSRQVDYTEQLAKQSEAARVQEFGKLATDAKSIPAGDRAHFGGVAIGLLRDAASSAAGSSAPAAPGEPAKTTAADTGTAEEYVISLYAWIAVCKDRVDEWSSFYSSLREAANGVK